MLVPKQHNTSAQRTSAQRKSAQRKFSMLSSAEIQEPVTEFIPTDTSEQESSTATKIALANAMAQKYATSRRIQEKLLRLLKDVSSDSAKQVLAIERYVDKLPYRREPIEILRNPEHTLEHGGDCDDLATLVCCLVRAVAIPCEVQAIENENLEGFHLRAVAYFPPSADSPEFAVVLDPVYRSEREWTLFDKQASGQLKQHLDSTFSASRVYAVDK